MDKLNVIVVPITNAFVALPAVMMRQILPSAPLMPTDEFKQPFVIGSLIVHSDKLPVIDASLFIGAEPPPNDDDTKLIWFAPLHPNNRLNGFILQSKGRPQFVSTREADLIDRGLSDHPLMARVIQVRGHANPKNLPVFIIDLEALEAELTS